MLVETLNPAQSWKVMETYSVHILVTEKDMEPMTIKNCLVDVLEFTVSEDIIGHDVGKS